MKNINPHLNELGTDYLYHLGLESSMNLKGMFGDTRYVCMSGSPVRAEIFAGKAAEELGIPQPQRNREQISRQIAERIFEATGLAVTEELVVQATSAFATRIADELGMSFPKSGAEPIGKTERFSLYKTGPVISVSHGMGMPSVSILLHEITKLLHYAGVKDPTYLRLGTSGGIGVPPGTVVLADRGLNGELKPEYKLPVLGKVKSYPTQLNDALNRKILAAQGKIHTVLGHTVGTDDFYEGQGRLDGALDPGYTEEEKMRFLHFAHVVGARNFEMESPEFAAFCLRADIKAAVMCVTLLNRFNGDQVTSTPAELADFSDRAQNLALNFIKTDFAL